MRLSEAIRKGSVGMRPIYGPTFEKDGEGNVCGVCAIGAAIRGAGADPGDPTNWRRLFPATSAIPSLMCPACSYEWDNMQIASAPVNAVIHLHESHHWTFEQIADWVQAQEAIHGIGQDEPVQARELVEA